jgi:acetylglutamate kinase
MNKKIVIKLGGSSLSHPETLAQLSILVRGYQLQGCDVAVVHGGGPAINEELTRKNITWQFINGQRQTTPEMMSVIEDVLAIQVNTKIVDSLKANGISAQNLSGANHKILFCSQSSEELMQVGNVETVNVSAIEYVMGEAEAVPVIAPIGFDMSGKHYNVNADWAAVKIAVALDAEMLIFLTDQDGILDGSRNLLHHANPGLIQAMVDEGSISGGMYTKVMTMLHGLKEGVKQVRVLNASRAGELLNEPEMGTSLVLNNFNQDFNQWTRNLN